MKQAKLAAWLKFITIIVGIMGLICFLIIIPTLGKDAILTYPELKYLYWPYLISAWVLVIPCYIVLLKFWGICCEISNDNSFSEDNANALHVISKLALFDTLLLFIIGIVLFFLNMLHPGFLIASFFIDFVGIAIAVISATLSHLVEKACNMKEENDLTI